jgi:hypothetical protein
VALADGGASPALGWLFVVQRLAWCADPLA